MRAVGDSSPKKKSLHCRNKGDARSVSGGHDKEKEKPAFKPALSYQAFALPELISSTFV